MRNSAAEEKEEGEEFFYESLDRILSSSCSSTSPSDDDGGGDHHHRHLPCFPPPVVASYDVWISEPSSVEERRRRLLQQLGLIGDPALSRAKSAAEDGGDARTDGGPRAREGNMGRSVSSDGLCRRPDPSPAVALIARSRSDGDVDPNPVHNQHQPTNKPSPVQRSRPSSVEDRKDSDGGSGNEDNGGDGDRRCIIKNLDNGKEFVVKEFREEDGIWNKVREVGTGRQLTMEEFEMCVGRSPIVQELMRRQNVEDSGKNGGGSAGHDGGLKAGPGSAMGLRWKKRGSWLRSIKNMAGSVVTGGYYYRDRRSSDEMDSSSEKGGRRSSSATDDSQDGSGSHDISHVPDRIRVRQYGKNYKELTGLYLTQEIQAHNGSIWSIKFSSDGRYLASAGEDCVIHVWEVSECQRKGELLTEGSAGENGSCNPFLAAISNGSPESALALACLEGNHWEKKRRAKVPNSRKSVNSDHLVVPDLLFALGEKPVCSFKGHLYDVLDLSWSKSQYLLSSSMDKTVKLWHMSSNSCLKSFSHSDYVTCIQFNPVDDRYFISGSLDEKVRIWSIPDRQIVDWNDLHEMVTAACYTPDGQGALVGSHKGSCHLYDTSDNKLHQKSQIDLQNKKKKSSHKKITGFQFAPGSSSEVLVTSADSRIRVIDGIELVHKFKGFRNTSSQISASSATNGKHVVCASEDSHVYVWRYDADSQPSRSKCVVSVTQSYEHFHCQDVTVAVPWPSGSMGATPGTITNTQDGLDHGAPKANPQMPAESNDPDSSPLSSFQCIDCSPNSSILNTQTNHCGDRVAATWPEEKLLASSNQSSPRSSVDLSLRRMHALQSRSAWGMVIVTAGRGGRIKTFQNFGFPVRL